MTLDEAIKDLRKDEHDLRRKGWISKADAHLLGIEALKLELKNRGTLQPGLYPLLPGETKN